MIMSGTYRRFAYDGTYEGLLCVAVKCINLRVVPELIMVAGGTAYSHDVCYVRTDLDIAGKMHRFIGERACARTQQMVMDCFLTAMPDKEKMIVSLIAKAVKFGACVADDYDDQMIRRIQLAILDLYREEQSYFMSFEPVVYNDVTTSVINPKNIILPVMKHDILRKTDYDNMLIYDTRHHMVLYRNDESNDIVDIRKLRIDPQNRIEVICDDIWQYLLTGAHLNGRMKKTDRLWYVAG